MQQKNIAHSVFPSHNGVLSHAAAFFMTISFVVYSSTDDKTKVSMMKEHLETFVRFLHIISFATLVGVQFWMHVSGFTIYKTLTRKAFAQVQSKIFPMYFMTGIVTSATSLLSFIYINPVMSWTNTLSFYQALGLLVCFLCFLINYLYIGPETIRLVLLRAQRVKFLGVEDGIGPVNPKLVNHDETFRDIKGKFIRMHAACSLVNVICYAACGVCMWCFARKAFVM